MTTPLFASLRLEALTGAWLYLWLVTLVAGLAFLAWTYRGIWERSGRKSLAWGLLALRVTGVVCLLLMLAKPTWTRATDETEVGRVAIVVDTSRSMTLPDESGTPRYAKARAAMDALTRAFADGKQGRLAVDLFDVTGAPLTELPKDATAEFTDLTKAIRRTIAQVRSRPVSGVILISDGIDLSGRANFADWEDAGVPIHTVGFRAGDDLDLAVREPTAQRRVLVQNEMTVAVPVAKKGKAAVEATVVLRRGREELARKVVSLPAGDAEQVVSLAYKPDQPGSFELTASVESAVGEKDAGNNAANFPLDVVKDPIRVLYVEGFLRNESAFLSRHFTERDPDVAMIRDVRRTPRDEGPSTLADGLLDEKTLDKIDVVVLGDMESSYISPPQWRSLLKWLEGKNRSLLVLGGYESFGPDGFAKTPVADLLPVTFTPAASQSEKPFTFTLTDKGKADAMFTVDADAIRSAKLWAESPPLDGMPLVGKAKPGAEVLAVNPEVVIDGTPAVALAVQRAPGGGLVMVMCPDTTWKWSRFPRLHGQDDTLYSRFWSQTIRRLAGRETEDGRPALSLRTETPVVAAKRKVTARVTRQRRPGADLAGAVLSVDVVDPKGATVPGVAPRVDPSDPDVFTVDFTPSLSGRYEINATLKADGKTLANQSADVRVRGDDLELQTAQPRGDHLRAIASATGGIAVEAGKEAEIAAAVPRTQRRRVQMTRSEFWDSPWLFAAFLGAISGEWLLRRRNHLV